MKGTPTDFSISLLFVGARRGAQRLGEFGSGNATDSQTPLKSARAELPIGTEKHVRRSSTTPAGQGVTH